MALGRGKLGISIIPIRTVIRAAPASQAGGCRFESGLSLHLQRPHSRCCVASVIILIIVSQVLKRLAGLLVGTP